MDKKTMIEICRECKNSNKGFSLVELIVVIAIMAVLIGVLAPTLIGKIEDSRKSTDIQNLDTVRRAIFTAMSDDYVHGMVTTDADIVVTEGTDKSWTITGTNDALTNEVKKITMTTCVLTSNKFKTKTITFTFHISDQTITDNVKTILEE